MIIDSRLEFSDAQALTATADSTNVIDLSQDRDVGVGNPLWVVVQIDTAVGGTSPTVDIDIETATDEVFTAPVDVASFAQIDDTSGVQGARFVLALPFTNLRFLRLEYTLGGTSPTVTLSAWLTDQHPTAWQAYPDADN